MMKTMQVIVAGVLMTACAARPPVQATPVARAQAVGIVFSGGTPADVAAELSISQAEARRLVRATARELLTWLQTTDDRPAGVRAVVGPVSTPAVPGTVPAPAPSSPSASCDVVGEPGGVLLGAR